LNDWIDIALIVWYNNSIDACAMSSRTLGTGGYINEFRLGVDASLNIGGQGHHAKVRFRTMTAFSKKERKIPKKIHSCMHAYLWHADPN
jgi:hypothetical protein